MDVSKIKELVGNISVPDVWELVENLTVDWNIEMDTVF